MNINTMHSPQRHRDTEEKQIPFVSHVSYLNSQLRFSNFSVSQCLCGGRF